MKPIKSDILSWIEEWFLQHTNGDWEHSYGIKIETLDNPGWHVAINLAKTPLEQRPFDAITEEKSERDWISCRVKDGRFEGFSGPTGLHQILTVFKAWAEK